MSPRLLKSREEVRRLYPPRATRVIDPLRLERFKGFVAQYKYNDIRTLILLVPGQGVDREADQDVGQVVELMTRKREPHLEYSLTPAMRDSILGLKLDPARYHVLDGGVLRRFSVARERPIIVWDILVHDDLYLLGTTHRDRYALLQSVCGHPVKWETATGNEVGLVVSRNLWLAPIFLDEFDEHFRHARETDCLEGLLLKNPAGKLTSALTEENNTSWQLKARKTRADYTF